jgi:hypothetical protein
MVRFFFCAAVGLSCLAQAQTYTVKTDPQLKKPVTLSVKYDPVDLALKAISKQAGVDLETSGSMGNAKLTIFVKGVPTNLLLEQIASVLGGQWEDLSGVRFFRFSRPFTDEESAYLAAEDKQLKSRAQEDLDNIIRRLQAESDASAAPDSPNTPGSSPLPFRAGPPGLGMNRAMLADQIGKVLAGASESELDEFWKGDYASIEIGADNSRPARVPGGRLRSQPRGSSDPGMVFARYDVYGTHNLQVGSSRFPVVSQRFDLPPFVRPEDTLAATKFGKEVLGWPQLTVDPADTLFNEPISDVSAPKVGFGAAAKHEDASQDQDRPLHTQSEILEQFFKLSNIPIVADGFRISLPQTVAEPKGSTAIAWLNSLSSQSGCFIRIQDGFADVRQGGFWRLAQYEAPESVLRALEANASKLKFIDYANFFGSLTPAQARAFQSSTPPKVDFPTAFVEDSIPALRFLDTLSSNFPVDGRAVPLADLGGNSQALLGQAVADSVFSGKLWTKWDGATPPKAVEVAVRPANVQQPEGTVSGVSLQIILPLGQTITYDIPIPL